MKNGAKWKAALAAMLALALMGCSGGDDDDDDDGGTNESEPNDSLATADDLGTSTSFSGTCSDADIDDFFSFATGTGTVNVSVTWDEGAGDDQDLDFYLYDTDDTELSTDFNSPPGDSPGALTGTITTAGTATIQIECFTVTGAVDYSGTVDLP